uniref:Secreted protein n=1 Tax=Arundo donax TaxID=35708 RepID=A0A0A9CW07_ARUDO
MNGLYRIYFCLIQRTTLCLAANCCNLRGTSRAGTSSVSVYSNLRRRFPRPGDEIAESGRPAGAALQTGHAAIDTRTNDSGIP